MPPGEPKYFKKIKLAKNLLSIFRKVKGLKNDVKIYLLLRLMIDFVVFTTIFVSA
jgi:hypothetical protein